MNCIFCKIVKGEIPSFKVWEDGKHLAFLSINPIREGHVLIIPKAHSEYLFDMDDEALVNLIKATKPVERKLKALKPKSGKIGLRVAGLEVAHTHVHLIPMDSEGDLDFKKAKPASSEILAETLTKLKQA